MFCLQWISLDIVSDTELQPWPVSAKINGMDRFAQHPAGPQSDDGAHGELGGRTMGWSVGTEHGRKGSITTLYPQ